MDPSPDDVVAERSRTSTMIVEGKGLSGERREGKGVGERKVKKICVIKV